MIIGAFLYYLFCPEVLFVKWIDFICPLNIHITLDINHNIFTKLFRYYFFDFLWAFSFTNTIFLLLKNKAIAPGLSCIITVCTGFFLDLLQRFEIVHGTFDFIDILVELFGSLGAVIIIKFIYRRKL